MPLLRRKLTNRIAAGALICCLALAATPAAADYVAEYNAYKEALERNDEAAMAVHALAAWRAGEEALGDHETTAILAYNYAQAVLFSDPEKAATALSRVEELQKAGVGQLPANDVRLYRAYIEFSIQGGKRKETNALREALQTRDEAAEKASFESAII